MRQKQTPRLEMKDLGLVVVGALAFAMLSGCHAPVLPTGTTPVPFDAGDGRGCGSVTKAVTLAVCITVPKSGIAKLTVTDSIYGDGEAAVGKPITIDPSRCAVSGNVRRCGASFQAPQHTLNQIRLDVQGSSLQETTSGAFPVELGATSLRRNVVVDGSGAIASIVLVPFHDTSTKPGSSSNLPLGQTEHVWIVAEDSKHRIIVGGYRSPIAVTASSSNLVLALQQPSCSGSCYSPCTASCSLANSSEVEALAVYWLKGFTGSSGAISLMAASGSVVATLAPIVPSSGVVYYQAGPNRAGLGAGPVAVDSNTGDVYFAINDTRDTGCKAPGSCATLLERFNPSTQKFSHVAVPGVPGASQLFVAKDGALWMATFQPVGAWNHELPAYRMPPNEFSKGSFAALPTSTFGEPSGFVEDPSGNLWISSCKRSECKQDQRGTPVLLESRAGSYETAVTIELPMSCTQFGYSGYTVGDVAYYSPNGSLYVLGLNDGAAPPAHGTVWQYSPATQTASCVSVPSSFNPSPYFAYTRGAKGDVALIFGIGGNNANFRWQPDHGFYKLRESANKMVVTEDLGPRVIANHVSASGKRSKPGTTVYYTASGTLDLRFSGLGTYVPSAKGAPWSIFPSASFSGDQYDNGVAAVSNGAWFAAAGVCGANWKGVCLADAIIVPSDSAWGALPGLYIPRVGVGASAGFGVITNPDSSDLGPLVVHSGPFYAKDSNPDSCKVLVVAKPLTFSVTGVRAGLCQIIIGQTKTHVEQPLVTVIK